MSSMKLAINGIQRIQDFFVALLWFQSCLSVVHQLCSGLNPTSSPTTRGDKIASQPLDWPFLVVEKSFKFNALKIPVIEH